MAAHAEPLVARGSLSCLALPFPVPDILPDRSASFEKDMFMLAPDPEKTQAALISSFSAAKMITIYSGTMRFVVGPQIKAGTFPGWFDPIKAAVETVVRHGSDWMDDLCIDMTTALIQTIVSFNVKFQDVADRLINLETEIEMRSGIASPEQQQRAIDLFTQLRTEVARLAPQMKADHKRITALLRVIKTDHEALSDMSSLIANNIPDAGTIVKQIKADLGDDFMDVSPNGRCLVAVSIRSNVDVKIKRTAGDHPELLPYMITLAVLQRALDDSAKATLAFRHVLNVWGFMQGLLDSIIEDLAKGAGQNVIAILREAMLDAARKVWMQLSETAQSLSGPTSI